MRVEGRWHDFGDGIFRPVVEARLQLPNGAWQNLVFLLDSGADRTILETRFFSWLAPRVLPDEQAPRLGGVGGQVESKLVQTRLAFIRSDSQQVLVNGPFSVFTQAESSDISILGRDVTDNFDVIYSLRKREVLLLAPPHDYVVQLPF